MKNKKGFYGGFFKGMNFSAKITEIASFAILQKVKETEEYKKMGYEKWEDFCLDEIGISDDTLRRRFKTLQDLGPELVTILNQVGCKWHEVKMIENFATDEEKTMLKKDILKIEDKKVPFNEEYKEEIQEKINIIIEKATLAQKAEKIAKSKSEGLEKEHKKEVEAYQKEVAGLKVQIINPKLPAEFEKVFNLIEEKVTEVVLMANRMNFGECHKEIEADGLAKAKYLARVRILENQFTQTIEAVNVAICER